MSNPEQIIQLDQFLKVIGLVSTGGQAKVVIQSGEVRLNGEVETRRKKKLHDGDIVTYEGESHSVDFSKLGKTPRSS
jgi:ribosome-associated protein